MSSVRPGDHKDDSEELARKCLRETAERFLGSYPRRRVMSPRAFAQTALMAHLCDCADGGGDKWLRWVASRGHIAHSEVDPIRTIPSGLLLPTAILLVQKTSCGECRDFLERYLGAARSLLTGESPPGPTDVGIFEKTAILWGAGLSPKPAPAQLDSPSPPLNLPLDRAAVSDAALKAEALTLWGLQEPPPGSGSEALAVLLHGLGVWAARAYDLAVLARVARANAHLGQPTREFVEFLAYQQREDGLFGFYRPETDAISTLAPEADPTERLSIPIALEACIFLAEHLLPQRSFLPTLRSRENWAMS